MPKFTLTYFSGRGLAEISRWLFTAAEQPFDDIRVSDEEDGEWEKLKPSTPFGQLPVLEVDGFKLGQSGAIALYLATEFGLAGKSTLERARIHMICDCLSDVTKNIFPIIDEVNPDKKAELIKQNFGNELKTSFGYLEKFVTDNGDTGYFVGDKLTLADIAFAVSLDRLSDIQADLHLDSFPKLKQLNEKVRSHPKISEWIAKRPVSSY